MNVNVKGYRLMSLIPVFLSDGIIQHAVCYAMTSELRLLKLSSRSQVKSKGLFSRSTPHFPLKGCYSVSYILHFIIDLQKQGVHLNVNTVLCIFHAKLLTNT